MNAAAQAPELHPSLQWLNADPLRLGELRGRVVALAFWSAGSGWSQRVLDDLAFLQGKHAEGLTVLGIHTPKFDAERDPRLVHKVANQLGLRFPIAHDADFVTWQHYGISGWPSVVLVDPQGRIRDRLGGDHPRSLLDSAVSTLLEEAGEAGTRTFEIRSPVLRPEPRTALSFPAGLAASASHLYICDSGHHRVLECSHDGQVLREFGSGSPGLIDGAGIEASFQSPRGVALVKDALYVADTGNHALRRIRLQGGEVETVAGTGQPGDLLASGEADAPTALALDSPVAVAGGYDKVYVAMATAQQVWEYDLAHKSLRPLAGSGELGLSDGAGRRARFAQPMALALVQQTLYVADAAASAIRSLNVATGQVHTLVGQGLYDFGNEDGTRSASRLQCPQALALDPKSPLLWIADSYNNAIRLLRLGGGDLRRFELDHKLSRPCGLACTPGQLFIASTDAHEVLRVDVEAASVRRLPVGE